MKQTISLFLFLICFSLLIQAQDSAYTRKIINRLASPEMYGRGYTYNGDKIAAEFISNELMRLEIPPVNESYFQKYSFPVFAMEGTVSITLNGKILNPFTDYRIAPFAKTVQQDKIPVIHADASLLSDSLKMAAFYLEHKEKLPYSFIYFKESTKEAKEAISKIHRKQENPCRALGYLIGVEKMPAWNCSSTNMAKDFSFIHLLSSLISIDDTLISIYYQNELKEHHSQNVCALIEGTAYPDSFIVFSAHYDHLGTMGDQVIFPGAHDNASGVATVLNLAKYYKIHPLPYSVLFCFFSGEECGLKGSFYFAENPLVDLSKIKQLINLDLLCGGDEGIAVVNGNDEKNQQIMNAFYAVNEKEAYIADILSRNNSPNSDHYPFTLKGVPSLFIFTRGTWNGNVHDYTDTPENCSLSPWGNIFKLLVEGVERMN